MTAVEWADKYFRLPEGSSQIPGSWTTQPLQVVPLNMMGNDAIKTVVWQKSARVGYTKCIVAAGLYLSEHKSRNGLYYQPTDDDAKDFVVDEIDPVIAEMPIIQSVFPSWNLNNALNTVRKKAGSSFILDIKGAWTPKNFRRMTKGFVIGDEVGGWPLEVGTEGDPIQLARQRLKGAAFPKDIWGSTPTVKGVCHTERLMKECDEVFRFHLPCPHCKHEQVLKWGGKGARHGMRWNQDIPPSELTSADVWYECENSSCAEHHPEGKGRIYYNDLGAMSPAGRWISDQSKIWTVDGINFFSHAGIRVSAPLRCGLHINALYSLTLTYGWVELVQEWLAAKGDPGKLKTFINTVLGELWEDETGERLDHEGLYARREPYMAKVPMGGLFLTCFIDTQDDRLEAMVVAWGEHEESWVVDYKVIYGEIRQPEIWDAMYEYITASRFKHESGGYMRIRRFGQDTGGHFGDEVHAFVKRFPDHFGVACKGDNKYAQPVARYDDSKNKHGTRWCWIGTDTAKDTLYGRYPILPKDGIGDDGLPIVVPGACHFPIAGWCTPEFFQQATAEVKKLEVVKGRKVYRYFPKTSHERNEVLDCYVGNLAMLRLSMNYFDLKLPALKTSLLAKLRGPASEPVSSKPSRQKVTGGLA